MMFVPELHLSETGQVVALFFFGTLNSIRAIMNSDDLSPGFAT
jgi:hypothetical protein